MLQSEAAVQPASSVVLWIRRHPVAALVVLVFFFEWIVMIPLLLDERGLLPVHLPRGLELVAGWGPGIAAAIVTGALAGRSGVKKLFSRYLIWRVNPIWYAIAVFGTAAFILGGIAISMALGRKMPDLPIVHVPVSTAVLAFVVTVIFGFVANLEDVAWRGVALPKLQEGHTALTASLIIGVLEGLTHLPYFFVPGDFRQQTGLWFMAFTLAIVILMTWMYNSTRGSLLIVVLYHACQNAWANLLDTTPARGPNDLRPFIWAVVLMWVAALAVIAVCGPRRLTRRPPEEMPQFP